MTPITWHQARMNDRVFARKREAGPWYAGHLSKIGRQGKFVTIAWDDGGSSKRHFDEVYFPKEIFKAIEAGTRGCSIWIEDGKETFKP